MPEIRLTADQAADMARKLCAEGDFATAIPLLIQLANARPDDPRRLYELGLAVAGSGDPGNAAPMLLAAGRAAGKLPPAEALPLLEAALAVAPDDASFQVGWCEALIATGRAEEAVAYYARRARPWDAASHEPSRLDYDAPGYSYDEQPGHRLFPRRFAEFLGRALPDHRPRAVLDLGCGTGLLAMELPKTLDDLVGIDLSPAMLRIAADRGRYDRLMEGDLVTATQGLASERFDTILSSCVLYHIADLAPVFAEATRLLTSPGAFVISVDPMPDGNDIGVTAPGEYAHSRAYLRRLAGRSGLAEAAIEIGPHRGFPGFYCAFRKV